MSDKPTIHLDDLAAAVDKGLLSKEQAEALKRAALDRTQGLPDKHMLDAEDDEGFRFVSGFADIFLAIGAATLFWGLAGVGLEQSASGLVTCVAISWALAEVFATWQRRTLPSMICAGFFVYFAVSLTVFLIYGMPLLALLEPPNSSVFLADRFEQLPVFAFVAASIFYARFRLPFALFIAGQALVVAIVAYIIRTQGLLEASNFLIPVLFGLGLLIFAGVLYFDSKDRFRRTRLSDNAFWLSLVASPLIVHSIMWQTAVWLLGNQVDEFDQLEQVAGMLSIAVICIFFVLMVVALIVDRRAVLFSTLIYVTAVVVYLFSQDGQVTEAVSFVPIIMGGGMIAVGSFWHVLRRFVFFVLPLGRIEHLLAPVRA